MVFQIITTLAGIVGIRRIVGFAVAVSYSVAGLAAVPAVDCNNCSSAQEEAKALATPGLGVRFVYDLPGNEIRKFKVYRKRPASPPSAPLRQKG